MIAASMKLAPMKPNSARTILLRPSLLRPYRRAGYSLIEVTVSGALLLAVIGLMSEWTIRMVRLNRQLEQSHRDRQSLDRLAEALVSDCRDAKRWDGASKRFEGYSDRTVEYEENLPYVERTEKVAGKVSNHEFYRIPANQSLIWPADSETTKVLVWKLQPSSEKPSSLPTKGASAWKVEVGIGRKGNLRSLTAAQVQSLVQEEVLP